MQNRPFDDKTVTATERPHPLKIFMISGVTCEFQMKDCTKQCASDALMKSMCVTNSSETTGRSGKVSFHLHKVMLAGYGTK